MSDERNGIYIKELPFGCTEAIVMCDPMGILPSQPKKEEVEEREYKKSA